MKVRRAKPAGNADQALLLQSKRDPIANRRAPERNAGGHQAPLARTLSPGDTAANQAAMRYLQQHLGNQTVARLAAANATRPPLARAAPRSLQRAPDAGQ